MAMGDIPGGGGIAGGGGATGPGSNAGPGFSLSGKGYPVINVVTGMKTSIDVVLYDTFCDGNIVDLNTLDVASAWFTAKETRDAARYYIRKQLTLPDRPASSSSGVAVWPARFTIDFLPPTTVPSFTGDLSYAGIWMSAITLCNAAGDTIAEWPSYLAVRKGINHGLICNSPLGITEVRLAMRDTCPEFNMLLLDVQFSDTEIAYAITRPVDEWNESPPPVGTYTYATFPYRENWTKATIGMLLTSAAYWYARNKLPYTAGGVSVNDMDKDNPYTAMAAQIKAEWKDWMMRTKVRMNAEQCYGSLRSRAFR